IKLNKLTRLFRFAAVFLLLAIVIWFVQRQIFVREPKVSYRDQSIAIPAFTNLTGQDTLGHIGQVAAHWITKELSDLTNAQVVSSESGSELIKLADMKLSSPSGRVKYSSLTGAVNIVDVFYTQSGSNLDTSH